MNIEDWYSQYFESRLNGRYVTLKHIDPILKSMGDSFGISVAGTSEKDKNIPMLKIGTGEIIVLGWSQMHGNESTTTKAVFDFLKFIGQTAFFSEEIAQFKKTYTFYLLPILNPDGAALYTRENANKVDLNRDAKQLTQKESRVLRTIFDSVSPQMCLNLHDQRSIFGLETQKPATVSFLAPAANKARSITDSRKLAMQHIVRMNHRLQQYIPDQVGRYDDTYNEDCVGDTFQKAKVPTILFEAGHYELDYTREKTREFIFYVLLELFGITTVNLENTDHSKYFKIPENEKNYTDILIHNVTIEGYKKKQKISIKYQETLVNNQIEFIPKIDSIGQLSKVHGHREIDVKGAEILINSQNNYHIGQKVLQICNKNDIFTEYFTLV